MNNGIVRYDYTGSLAKLIESYVAEKRGMGVKFNSEAKKLRHFDRATTAYGLRETTLTKDFVLAYTAKTPNESVSNHIYRLKLVQRFAEYMVRCGHEAYIPVTTTRHNYDSTFTPYVFSNDEIGRFFKAADSYQYGTQSRYAHIVIPVTFRMIYSCGLRASEVANLKVDDVDLKNGAIMIGKTKFCKSRIVPLSNSLHCICKEYATQMHSVSYSDAPFFPNAKGDFFSVGGLYSVFRKLLSAAGISHGGKGAGPRLHDMRHTFAVHCLRQWTLANADLAVALPYLSAFLGHTGLASTQKYLRLTAELYPHIIELYEQSAVNCLINVGGDDNE